MRRREEEIRGWVKEKEREKGENEKAEERANWGRYSFRCSALL